MWATACPSFPISFLFTLRHFYCVCVAICFRMALDLYYFQSKLCLLWWYSGNCNSLHGLVGCCHFSVKQAKESPNGWATEYRQMSSANESKSSLELCSKAYIFNNQMALVVCKNILALLEGSVIFGVGSWYGKLGDVQSEKKKAIKLQDVSRHYVVFTQPHVTPNL